MISTHPRSSLLIFLFRNLPELQLPLAEVVSLSDLEILFGSLKTSAMFSRPYGPSDWEAVGI